jgi:GUN4-like/NACHT domain
MVVMLDGFDELEPSQRPAIARWLHQQMRKYPRSVFIVTSRPKAYQEQQGSDQLELGTILWVQPFNAEQRRDLVERWYLCQERYANAGRNTPDVIRDAQAGAATLLQSIEGRQELRDLAQNPLLLNMMMQFHRLEPSTELPKRKVELYRGICRLQLRDKPQARQLALQLVQSEAQVILQMLALKMMEGHLERLERDQLLQCLGRYLREQAEAMTATDFLQQVEQVSELLVNRDGEYEFAHLSFQEYLAATQIAQQKQEKMLYEHFAESWWKQTILLYAGQVNPTRLIQAMLERGFGELAYTCVQETTKRLDEGLIAGVAAERERVAELARVKQQVQDSRFEKLDELLRAQRWVEADQETYRLMITAVGKEVGQYFTSDELLNFPCDVLRTIDDLWVTHSQGRFGFTVQRKIYVSPEVGGKLDGKYDLEAYRKFGDAVGWRKKGKWIYEEATKNASLSSPDGVFPFCCVLFVLFVGQLGGWFLFSRTKTCEP